MHLCREEEECVAKTRTCLNWGGKRGKINRPLRFGRAASGGSIAGTRARRPGHNGICDRDPSFFPLTPVRHPRWVLLSIFFIGQPGPARRCLYSMCAWSAPSRYHLTQIIDPPDVPVELQQQIEVDSTSTQHQMLVILYIFCFVFLNGRKKGVWN